MNALNPFGYPVIYLASQSPRRAQLLEQMGVPFEVIVPVDANAAEDLETPLLNEKPLSYVQRVCLAKLQSAQAQIALAELEPKPILCSDTTVEIDGEILAKPIDAKDAARMLKLLSGRTHLVHTAIAVGFDGQVKTDCVTTQVTFMHLSTEQIEAYICSGEPFGKAGAYGIQGLAACFVTHLSGSYSCVMGLPLFELGQILTEIKM